MYTVRAYVEWVDRARTVSGLFACMYVCMYVWRSYACVLYSAHILLCTESPDRQVVVVLEWQTSGNGLMYLLSAVCCMLYTLSTVCI